MATQLPSKNTQDNYDHPHAEFTSFTHQLKRLLFDSSTEPKQAMSCCRGIDESGGIGIAGSPEQQLSTFAFEIRMKSAAQLCCYSYRPAVGDRYS
jgi:hypothetical protein